MYLSELRSQLLFPEDIDGQLHAVSFSDAVFYTHRTQNTHSTEHTVQCSTTPCLGTGVQLQFWHPTC